MPILRAQNDPQIFVGINKTDCLETACKELKAASDMLD